MNATGVIVEISKTHQSPEYTLEEIGELLEGDPFMVRAWMQSRHLVGPGTPKSAAEPPRLPHGQLIDFVLRCHDLLPRLEAPSLLIVDDDPLLLRLYRQLIARWLPEVGYYATSSPYDAVVLALAKRTNLILIDLHLPMLSGDQLCRWLREYPLLRTVPIVGLSADGASTGLDRMRAAGADDVLEKSTHSKKFIDLARSYLGIVGV